MSTAKYQTYRYDKLATPSTIRLIRITGYKFNNRIECKLCHAEQSTADYDALSYRWGDKTLTGYIYLYHGGRHDVLPVHRNLERFIEWEWSQRRLSGRWIWTDRICLNQNDGQEMGQQVPRMGSIFGHASRVLAWLGMDESEGRHLLPLLRWSGDLRALSAVSLYRQFSEETRLAAISVLVNEYWSRIWIVQEIVNAQHLVIIVGNVCMDFQAMKDRCFHLSSPRGNACIEYLSKWRDGHEKVDLWKILLSTNWGFFKSERLEDRVYGVLGLVAVHEDGTSPVDHINVDYTKSPSEVMLDAALESRPPLHECPDIFHHILFDGHGMIQEPIFDVLEKYLASERTSQRHKDLTSYIIRVCDAVNILSSLQGSLPAAFYKESRRHQLFVELDDGGRFEPSVVDSAILMGISMAVGFDMDEFMRWPRRLFHPVAEMAKNLENWRVCRMPQVLTQSPWRCARHHSNDWREHRIRGQSHTKLATSKLNPGIIQRACAKYSSSNHGQECCDGSQMTFDMPDVGFRLTLEQTQSKDDGSSTGEIRMLFVDERPAIRRHHDVRKRLGASLTYVLSKFR